MYEQLVSKSYRSIFLAWVIAIVWVIALRKPWIGVNLTLGAALETAVLVSYDIVIRQIFVPGAQKAKIKLFKFSAVKYALMLLMLYWLIHWEHVNLFAFCGGIVLVHFSLFSKLAGLKIVERRKNNQSSAEISISATSSKEN